MKKYVSLVVLLIVSSQTQTLNYSISGSYNGCNCSFQQNSGGVNLNQGYAFLNCSCTDFRLDIAFPKTFVENGVSLNLNGNNLNLTSPKQIGPICGGNGQGCLGYCTIDTSGNPHCTWGSMPPKSWIKSNPNTSSGSNWRQQR